MAEFNWCSDAGCARDLAHDGAGGKKSSPAKPLFWSDTMTESGCAVFSPGEPEELESIGLTVGARL
ncbi:MAG: hypothetical protein M0P22_09030, partial [Methanoculleus sp.]|nr:hypothetical protein [Methanoculleus sp.]